MEANYSLQNIDRDAAAGSKSWSVLQVVCNCNVIVKLCSGCFI